MNKTSHRDGFFSVALDLGDLGNIHKENLQKWLRAHSKRILRLSWPPAGLLRVVGTRELRAFVCPGFGP